MTRKFSWLLSLSLAAGNAGLAAAQDAPPAKTPVETPAIIAPAPSPMPAPVVEAPMTVAFVPNYAPRPGFSVSVELLQWWYKRDDIPSLLNTGNENRPGGSGLLPLGGNPGVAAPGTVADPGAVTLFGTDQYSYKTIPGIRLDVGLALLDNLDLEFNGFLAESQSTSQFFSGVAGTPFLTRPFFNQHDIIESGYDTSSRFGVNGDPNGNISGNMNFDAQNQFYGYEANVAWVLNLEKSNIQKLLLGVRHITLDEHLIVTENVWANQPGLLAFFPTPNPLAPASPNLNFNPSTDSIRIVDGFVTTNAFWGPQFGAQWNLVRGPLTFDFLTKFAVGVNHETIRVSGLTQRLTNGAVSGSGAGGLLAVSTNSGSFTHNELAVVPEIGLKLNFDVTNYCRVHVGYNMLYLSSVVRPGSQIDRRINPELVPHDVAYNPSTSGPLFPRAFNRDTDFFAHGVAFGLEVRY